jgi:hypothetical protein
MAITYQVALNLGKNELQNARIQNLGSAPGSPVLGQIYYDTGTNNLYVWDGAWTDLTIQGGGGSNATAGTPGYVQLAGDLAGAGSVATAPIITAGTIDATKISGTLKPSGTAAVGTEALRAIGTTASTALAGNTTLNAVTAPTASLSLNSQKITSLADGTASNDAVNLSQVQALVQGLAWKDSVRAASTANVVLASAVENTDVIDGVTLATGDRVLLKDQSTGSENGIYTVNASGAPTRAIDADTSLELEGAAVMVEEGTTNQNTAWTQTVDNFVLGTNTNTWVQFGAGQTYIGGAGLTLTGQTFDVVGTTNRITANANDIDIAATYVGQTSITTLGTITSGTWTGTSIALANGGTGTTTAAGARTNLVAAGYYSSATHGAGASISITQATHGLRASRGLQVQVQNEADGAVEFADVAVAATGDVTVTFAASQTANTKRVTIVG